MKCMLIGGGEIGRGDTPYETEIIDKEIIKMSEKVRPNLLFIGFASSHSDSYYDVIKKNFQKLGCETQYLKKSNCLYNPEIVKAKFQTADIIYVGGGDTLKLLERIEEYQLKPLFRAAMERNCVMAGISAGAILFAREGFSDAFILRGEKDSYEMIPGFDEMVQAMKYGETRKMVIPPELAYGAYGIPQSLPGRKMASEGDDWQTNPITQLRWMAKYVKNRYGSWKNAWDFWGCRGKCGNVSNKTTNWY